MNQRAFVGVFTVVFAVGCTETESDVRTVGSTTEALVVGAPLSGLTATESERFQAGAQAFAQVEGLADGLGPVFNEKSCQHCHSVGGPGGSGTQFEQRAGLLQDGVFNPLTAQGGQLFDLFSVANLTGSERRAIPNCQLAKNGEPIPANANVTALRRTTALFGLGLVDNTPDQTFLDLAAAQPAAIRGRVNMVTNLTTQQLSVGKFGWKSQVPSLFQFSGDAYLNEMGITNPQFPDEQAPLGNASLIAACDLVPGLEDPGDDVEAFTDFMSMLAPVEALSEDSQAAAGDTLFTQVGCDGCHVRTLTSGTSSPIAALNGVQYRPFSDFLLHDMGSLGDDIGGQGDALGKEMRTAPLWGLRLLDAKHQLLHDGRATSLADAVLKHDGQAANARAAFAALSSADRDKLLAFLKTL